MAAGGNIDGQGLILQEAGGYGGHPEPELANSSGVHSQQAGQPPGQGSAAQDEDYGAALRPPADGFKAKAIAEAEMNIGVRSKPDWPGGPTRNTLGAPLGLPIESQRSLADFRPDLRGVHGVTARMFPEDDVAVLGFRS